MVSKGTKTIYMSGLTNAMLIAMKNGAISRYSKKYKLDSRLVRAICSVESDRNALAIRIERHLKKAIWYKKTLFGIEVVRDYHHCSFGYMQIMFGTARHIGYLGTPFGLLNPEKAIKFGTKFLARCIKRYKGNVWDGVAAYNQGNNRYFDVNKNGIKDEDEKYRNQIYVDKVQKHFILYGGIV